MSTSDRDPALQWRRHTGLGISKLSVTGKCRGIWDCIIGG